MLTPGVTCCSREQMAMRACGIFSRRRVSYFSLESGNVGTYCELSVTSSCYGEHRQSRCVRLAVLMVIRRDDLYVQAALTVVYCAGALLVPVPASQRGVRAAGIISQKGMALPICK